MRGKKFAKNLGKAMGIVAKASDRAKRTLEPGIDKYLFWAGANAGLVYGAAELIDRSNYSDPTNAAIMMATGAALTAGNYAITGPRNRKLRGSVARLNRDVDKSRIASWIKTGMLATSVAYLGSELNPYFQQVRQDIFPKVRDPPLATLNKPVVPETKEAPKSYDRIGYSPTAKFDFTGTQLADKESMIGRIQRTLRWQPIYRAVERAHGMPQDTLAGMIMQESYGDPVQPNASDDGGLGVVHIQGTTAHLYGLKIYGDSNRDSDRNHGRQIREMLRQCNYDASCAEKYDDRAHVLKVLDTAGRIVREGKEKHGGWDEGVEYYRAPGKVGKNLTWRYLHNVKNWRSGIEDSDTLARASEDFEKRNGYPFSDYISRWHQMNSNWGLAEYNKRMNGHTAQ